MLLFIFLGTECILPQTQTNNYLFEFKLNRKAYLNPSKRNNQSKSPESQPDYHIEWID